MQDSWAGAKDEVSDKEPRNIAELMEEYEKEREETEVKDINPLMKYVNHEIKTIKDILSHMDREELEGGNEWLEGFLSALENVRDKLNKLNGPEVLSQELPVIPKFVVEWFEENKENFESKLKSIIKYPPQYDEDVTDFTKWVSNPVNKPIQTLGNMFNGYEVEEKEQKYIVKLPLPEDRTNDFAVVDIYGDIWRDGEWPSHCSQCKMTEKEIKALPKGEVYFEHFAVKVEEME